MRKTSNEPYDVLIVGGGPAGLSAALALGRARKRVLLTDSGPRRNATAVHMQNFVTRDGTPPNEFRAAARAELERYETVEVRDEPVVAITGERGAFQVTLTGESVIARRILLAVGLVDEMLPIPGFRELWGRSIFQCPYCHGFEVRDEAWGYLVLPHRLDHLVPFATMTRAWTRSVTVFTNGGVAVSDEARAQLTQAGIRLETAPITQLVAGERGLEAIALEGGARVPITALFVHPLQAQVPLVQSLGLALDAEGFVAADPMRRETSVPGVYVAGDLATRMQGAVLAAASGVHAASAINMELTMDLVARGELA